MATYVMRRLSKGKADKRSNGIAGPSKEEAHDIINFGDDGVFLFNDPSGPRRVDTLLKSLPFFDIEREVPDKFIGYVLDKDTEGRYIRARLDPARLITKATFREHDATTRAGANAAYGFFQRLRVYAENSGLDYAHTLLPLITRLISTALRETLALRDSVGIADADVQAFMDRHGLKNKDEILYAVAPELVVNELGDIPGLVKTYTTPLPTVLELLGP